MTDIYLTKRDGLKTLVVVPEIREDYPPELREAIALRRLVALGKPCPCGAQPTRINRAQRREIAARRRRGLPALKIRATVEHEADCCATDQAIDEIAARHGLTPVRWAP